jgi:hypothetical protein
MFIIKNAEEFKTGLRAKLLEMKKTCDEAYRGFVVATFHRVAMETPQWTGNAVSNWNLSVGLPDLHVDTTLKSTHYATDHGRRKLGAPGQKGDGRAIQRAVKRNRGRDTNVKVERSVYLTNAAENLRHNSYIQMLEENPNGFLRRVNNPGHMVEYTVNSVNGVGPMSLATFKALTVLKLGNLSNTGVPI